MFTTKNGCLGMGPPVLQQGDEIYVVGGSSKPLILRPIPLPTTEIHPESPPRDLTQELAQLALGPESAVGDNINKRPGERVYHTLVGPCYIHGIMDGETEQDKKEPGTIYIK